MTNKEQIIIDGKKEDCKILFRCKHIDDSAAYNMIRNGIKITPENAPICDFELMLIENTDSPFGFSSVCKRNNKEDVWEYSGFGHSGACSIVTALLKRLDRKTQEYENLKAEEKYLKQCCQKAGEELAKHSFEYDGKEKNLVVQAMELNEKYEKLEKALEEIEKILKDEICEECPGKEGCKAGCKEHQCLNIINKVKGEGTENE